MQARLVGISGPSAGMTFDIGGEETISIGRSAASCVRLADRSVSREHCRIEHPGDQFVVRDLGSQKGTLVNDEAVSERVLDHGDRITLGASQFMFLTGDCAVPPIEAPVEFEDDAVTTELSLSTAEAVDTDRGASGKLRAASQASHDLGILLRIATRIGVIRDEASVFWQLLGMLFEVVPAERGAILLACRGAEFLPAAAWNRTGKGVDSVPVCRTVLRKVCEERSGVLVHSVAADEELRKVQSARLSQAHSMLCVPIVSGERVLGAIYLDAVTPTIEFSDSHLQITMGISAVAALAVENVRRNASLQWENERLKLDLDLRRNLLGDSPSIAELRQLITRVADTDSTVLICGESGTGKELVARAIHDGSGRADRPFVAINCAALTETLLESELFGHEKGAFTGAVAQKRGHIELASGGTLFLDEVGELAIGLQAKLLRALQEREVVRVGGTRAIKVDVRVLAATNCDLSTAVASGAFRQDLFYRLNVVRVEVPPLRARRDDIPRMAEHFLARYSDKCKRRMCVISPQAMQVLIAYHWPGNVRELENAIERAVVLGSGDTIFPEDLPETLLERPAAAHAAAPEGYHEALLAFKKQLILDAIAKSDGTLAHAARLLGLHPNYLHRLVTNLELRAAVKRVS